MRKNTIFVTILLLIVISSALYMHHLARQMAEEESERVSIWAEAQERFIMADDDEDIDFYTTIIERNNSIPVYMTDSAGNILLSRNVTHPVSEVRRLHGPIQVRIADDLTQYIWYDDSNLLTQLRYFPWVLSALVFVFVIAVVIVLYTSQRAEQNHLWVGLSKETAHQLGTPISSLNAWIELLTTTYPQDTMIPEMRKDIDRLHVIADRFSKVGSEPELKPENLDAIVQTSASYMQTRLGKRIHISYPEPSTMNPEPSTLNHTPYTTLLSAPLFSWVLENIIKNAVDAGATEIGITLSDEGEKYQIEITDNGKGIPSAKQSHIFDPGFTTKQRGWGLGLSLARRIVEQYHHGRLTLVSSTLLNTENPDQPHGTTFRILLNKA